LQDAALGCNVSAVSAVVAGTRFLLHCFEAIVHRLYSDMALFSFHSSRQIVLGKTLVSVVLLQIHPPKEMSPLDLMAV
jgi:hypothetical protein